jgi:anti-sigma regulatory factor (Ser/Thr protein kinase)
MSPLKKSFYIKERDFIRAGTASIQIQDLLKSLGLDTKLIRRIAICCYEGEMNVVMHGEAGQLTIEIDSGKLMLDISDAGPGIEDIELAMQEGFSTASDEYRKMGFGAGMGLPNMKKNADRMTIHSSKGNGTRVRMLFSLNEEEGGVN